MIKKQKIVLKIEEFYNEYSKKDWNGYSAAPINEKQKEIVKDFILKLDNKYLKNLHIMPDPCGEIWLLWTTKNNLKKLTIAISEENILTYSFRDKNNLKNNIVDEYNLINENRTKIEFIKQKIENINNKKE